jgi:putative DNA methylase
MSVTSYPKRLIEVDLPIARISAHARREKSIRHGHISTLHIWWARRPLAACRAVICAALWPDPVDLSVWVQKGEDVPAGDSRVHPARFLEAAQQCMIAWGKEHLSKVSPESYSTFIKVQQGISGFDDPIELRRALLDFIADFANWDNSTDPAYLETARRLTLAAHEALGGEQGTRPLIVDPFAGGGSIPLESLRVGADAFASELNPIAVLLNKVVLEYIPNHGQKLADEVRKWGEWVKQEAEKELADFYPNDPDGATPIAYLWARTIQCEGPGCGAEVPLLRSLWLAKKANRSLALQLLPRPKAKRVDFKIIVKKSGGWVNQDDPKQKIAAPKFDGTVRRGSATCPCCGYTTPVASVREQIKLRRGGSNDARLLAVVATRNDEEARFYRAPEDRDAAAIQRAAKRLKSQQVKYDGPLSMVPNEPLPPQGTLGFRLQPYGFQCWGDMFTDRQKLLISTLGRLIKVAGVTGGEHVQLLLCFALGRTQDLNAATSTWANTIEAICGANRAQNRMPMVWDFVEANALGKAGGNWLAQVEWEAKVIEHVAVIRQLSSKAQHRNCRSRLTLPKHLSQILLITTHSATATYLTFS